ncbi:hypothetical protein FM996_21365 [Methylosinus sporium]|uniref:Uncharacterized protein n=1 Tax=Methylosinus sporium TaxID=428 RepID=A0A549SCP0_METSR|nr:hypothetical protein FM996_21365 [Methylosinus sporium]
MVSTTLERAGSATDSLWRSFIVDGPMSEEVVAFHLSPCMAQPSDLAPALSGTKSATAMA